LFFRKACEHSNTLELLLLVQTSETLLIVNMGSQGRSKPWHALDKPGSKFIEGHRDVHVSISNLIWVRSKQHHLYKQEDFRKVIDIRRYQNADQIQL